MLKEARERTTLVEPPSHWYVAMGNNDRGIHIVWYSETLLGMRNGNVGRQLNIWKHYKTVLDCIDPLERDPKMISRVEKAAVRIKKVTGFSPEEIDRKRQALSFKLQGARQAPSPIKVMLRA